MFEEQTSKRRHLEGGLIVRTLETRDDVTRLADFNARIHSESERDIATRLIMEHPDIRPEQWWVVEDAAGSIVSSLCLIPWHFTYEGVDLKSGEMGFVGTLPSHRRRGLIRTLVAEFDAMLKREGYDLTHIQGIPYYYRQFGYEYAVPLIPDIRLDPRAVPDVEGEDAYEVCRARPADAAELTDLYNLMTGELALTSARSKAVWSYLLARPSVGEGETWWLTKNGTKLGYFRTHRTGFGKGLIVSEVARTDADSTAAVLRALARMTREADKPYIKLETDLGSDIVRFALDLGAADLSHYAWQIRFVDPVAFLTRMAPVFERRLAGTGFAGLSKGIELHLYRSSLRMVFELGSLRRVERTESSDWRDGAALAMPPQLLVPLVLGYRTMDELNSTWHDFRPSRSEVPLLRILFPQVRSFFFTLY
jgi:predicted acetyltransferase